jgi:hypothetical protein
MIILLPFVQNQAITNAALSAKLLVLPFVSGNVFPMQIDSVTPVVVSSTIAVDVITSGELDASTRAQVTPAVCADMCMQIKQSGAYASGAFSWTNLGKVSTLVCAPLSC